MGHSRLRHRTKKARSVGSKDESQDKGPLRASDSALGMGSRYCHRACLWREPCLCWQLGMAEGTGGRWETIQVQL